MIRDIFPEKLLPKSLVVTSRTNNHYTVIKSKDFSNYEWLEDAYTKIIPKRFYLIKIGRVKEVSGVAGIREAIRYPNWMPEQYMDIQSIRSRLEYLAVNDDVISNLINTLIYDYPNPAMHVPNLHELKIN